MPRGQTRGRRGGSASSAATASARPGGEGHSRRHAGGLRPCTQSASPSVGLAVVRSGAFSSAWASSRGPCFTWGLVRHGCAPLPRAHLSRPPRRERSSLAVESVEGAGFLVTVGPGAHGTCAGRERRLGGRREAPLPPIRRRGQCHSGRAAFRAPLRAGLACSTKPCRNARQGARVVCTRVRTSTLAWSFFGQHGATP